MSVKRHLAATPPRARSDRPEVRQRTPASDATAPAEAFGPERAMDLQDSMGNQAVSDLISRQASGGTAKRDPAASFARATSGSGQEIPFRDQMEASFGRDFSHVEAHVGQQREMRAMGAHAAARGHQVAFADARPSLETVAHELTHVVQQDGGGGGVERLAAVSSPSDRAEQQAETVARTVAGGGEVSGAAIPPAPVGVYGWWWDEEESGVEGSGGGSSAEEEQDWGWSEAEEEQEGGWSEAEASGWCMEEEQLAAEDELHTEVPNELTKWDLFDEAVAEGRFSDALNIAVYTEGLGHPLCSSISYDPGQGADGLTHGEIKPGAKQWITIGAPAFSGGYNYCVSVIQHELLHVEQRSSEQVPDAAEREFHAYAQQVLDERYPLSKEDRHANAAQAMKAYQRMDVFQQNVPENLAKFQRVKEIFYKLEGEKSEWGHSYPE